MSSLGCWCVLFVLNFFDTLFVSKVIKFGPTWFRNFWWQKTKKMIIIIFYKWEILLNHKILVGHSQSLMLHLSNIMLNKYLSSWKKKLSIYRMGLQLTPLSLSYRETMVNKMNLRRMCSEIYKNGDYENYLSICLSICLSIYLSI